MPPASQIREKYHCQTKRVSASAPKYQSKHPLSQRKAPQDTKCRPKPSTSFYHIFYFLPIPSHHARSFSLRCGICSLISVSLSSKLALRALLRGLLFSGIIIVLLLFGPRSSAGKVDLGLNVSRLLLPLRGLAMPLGARESVMLADMGRCARRDFFVEAVAGGRL